MKSKSLIILFVFILKPSLDATIFSFSFPKTNLLTMQLPRIKDWLNDKDIFITGVTGFLGKVLLEKLIRSTPNLNRIYVLIRCKKGKSVQDRLNDLKKFELFGIVNERYPNWLDKVIPIEGDCSEIRLGISDNDWNILNENVSVIFHTAASVRFDDPLKTAILLNVRGTREVCQLALESKKLEVFVHVSTTYCNSHYKTVDEKLYPPLGDWKEDIRLAIEMDEQELNTVTKFYTYFQPNTYTYTKGIAESLVNDMCTGKIPTVIIRPSIVTAAFDDPFRGWIDNFNGPGALILATAKGINRVQWASPDIVPDLVPVDVVIKVLIIGACWKAIEKTKNTDVLHATASNLDSVSTADIMGFGLELAKYQTTKNQLWFPTMKLTKSYFVFTSLFLVLQLLPSFIIDVILKSALKKTFLVKIQRKIYAANMSLNHFTLNQWTFNREKTIEIMNYLYPRDERQFNYVKDIDYLQYIKNSILGGKKYLLKEDVKDKGYYFNNMYYVHRTTVYAFYALLCWMAYKMFLPYIDSIINNA